MLAIPLAALVIPGLLAFVFGRVTGRLWPGLALAAVAAGSGLYFLSRAQGAAWDDGEALNHLFAAFGISLPALVSAAVGAALARARAR